MYVAHLQCSKGGNTEAQTGLREKYMSLNSVRNYLLQFRRISEVDILVQKTQISAVLRMIGIPCYLTLLCDIGRIGEQIRGDWLKFGHRQAHTSL